MKGTVIEQQGKTDTHREYLSSAGSLQDSYNGHHWEGQRLRAKSSFQVSHEVAGVQVGQSSAVFPDHKQGARQEIGQDMSRHTCGMPASQAEDLLAKQL